MTDDQQPPEDFTLDGEKSREQEAAQGGIITRDDTFEPDLADEDAPDTDGKAEGDDDDAVEDPDDKTPMEDI